MRRSALVAGRRSPRAPRRRAADRRSRAICAAAGSLCRVPGTAGARPRRRTPSACQLRLAKIAIFKPLPMLVGPGECGAVDAVLLDSVILPDQTQGRRHAAGDAALHDGGGGGDWVREDVAPAALKLGAPLRGLDNFDSYECRGRNRVRGATLSEHGRANALDVRGVQARQRRDDRTDRRECRQGLARGIARQRLRALFDGARPGLRRQSRGAHPRRSRRAARQLQDVRMGRARAGRASGEKRTAGRYGGRRVGSDRSRCRCRVRGR